MAKRRSTGSGTQQRQPSAPTLPDDDDFLSETQTAAAFPFSVPWLQAKRLQGAAGGDPGPIFHKIGRKVLYRKGDVRAYLAAHRVDRSANVLPAADARRTNTAA